MQLRGQERTFHAAPEAKSPGGSRAGSEVRAQSEVRAHGCNKSLGAV